MAIFNGLNLIFPDQVVDKKPEPLAQLSQLSPLLIAMNEAGDIGVSATLRIARGGIHPQRVADLMLLRSQVFVDLKKRKQRFVSLYPENKDDIDRLIEDYLYLSSHRQDFIIDEWPDFLELDSAIFVALA